MKRLFLTILSSVLMVVGVLAENTKTVNVTFSDYTSGIQYAANEKHNFGNGLVIYTTSCYYFTTELRIYSSAKYNGYVISGELPGSITQMTLNAGYGKNYMKDSLNVFGSTDSISWDEVKSLSINTSIDDSKNYTMEFPVGSNYTRFKFDVKGTNQICLKSISVTYVVNEDSEDEGNQEPGDDVEPSEPIEPEPTVPSEPTVSNNGTKGSPYTVAEVKNTLTDKTGKWVKGTIYGTMVGTDIAEIVTSNFVSTTNIVIGDASMHIPVQLTENTSVVKKIREELNLVNHPYLKGKELLIQGDIARYANSRAVISPDRYEIAYEVPINSYGYATLYLDMPVKVPTGSTAYYCTTDGDMAYLEPIGNVIPGSVGVIIASEPNTTCVLTYTTASNVNEEAIIAANQLIGFAEETEVSTEEYAYYALNAKNNQIGFYIPQTATDEGFTAKAFKAYLQIPAEQNVSAIAIHRGNDETEVCSIDYISEDVIYDLQGRVAVYPAQGIYIRGGKKIVIR